MMNSTNSASLRFTDFSSPEGFASKSLATENTVEPGPMVRELIQNSLDAGHMAGREQVKVCFSLEEVKIDDLPGIREYRKAFYAAKETHKNHLENVRAQISRIEKSLESRTVKILNVRDNGIGLNSETMNSLLGDGTTSKDAKALAGSYGLGHFTAFPSSNLQFILYGGVMKDSTRTASAHTILASHETEDGVKGKDGFLIKGLHRKKVHNRYIFPKNGEIPSLIDSQLDIIEKEHGSGSVISITAFNDFLEDDEDFSVKAILETAAKHFSPAIHKGSLVVDVAGGKGSDTETLDAKILDSVIGENAKGRRSGEDKLSPLNAHNAYKTLVSGESERREVETSFGKITLYVRQSHQETTQINLFRSGMWITNKLPRNARGQYSDYKQFNALVLIDPPSEAFNLVRSSEGEKHLDVHPNRLTKEQRKRFNGFWTEVRQRIMESLHKSEAKEYSPSAFMLIPPEKEGPDSSKRGRSPKAERIEPTLTLEEVPEIMSSGTISGSSANSGSGTNKSNGMFSQAGEEPGDNLSFNRGGRNANVLTAAKLDADRVRLVIHSNENLANAGVRLSLDNGADASCEKPVGDQFIPFEKSVLLDGEPLDESSYRGGGGGALELQIGAMEKDQTKTVALHLMSALPRDAVVKVNVVSRDMVSRDK